jgi:rRNA maturation endonuclease Nob1
MSKKKAIDNMFNPEKYHMDFCHKCHGLGKTYNEDRSKDVCKVCGGFGLIKKQDSGFEGEVET